MYCLLNILLFFVFVFYSYVLNVQILSWEMCLHGVTKNRKDFGLDYLYNISFSMTFPTLSGNGVKQILSLCGGGARRVVKIHCTL